MQARLAVARRSQQDDINTRLGLGRERKRSSAGGAAPKEKFDRLAEACASSTAVPLTHCSANVCTALDLSWNKFTTLAQRHGLVAMLRKDTLSSVFEIKERIAAKLVSKAEAQQHLVDMRRPPSAEEATSWGAEASYTEVVDFNALVAFDPEDKPGDAPGGTPVVQEYLQRLRADGRPPAEGWDQDLVALDVRGHGPFVMGPSFQRLPQEAQRVACKSDTDALTRRHRLNAGGRQGAGDALGRRRCDRRRLHAAPSRDPAPHAAR